MGRTTYSPSRPGFIADPGSITRNSGRQIDWANVADSYKNADGKKVLPAGTVIGELLGGGKISPRVVTTNPATGILESTAVEGDVSASRSGHGVIVGGVLYENRLPDASGDPKKLAAAVKTELNAAGTGFAFEQFGDSRAS